MGEYIREFETVSAYTTSRENDYIEPWVSLTDSNGDINYNTRYEKLDYYALAADEHVNFGILNPNGDYYTTSSDGPIYGKFGVFFDTSVDGSQISNWGTIFTSGTNEISMNSSTLLVNGSYPGNTTQSASATLQQDYIYVYQCNKASGNYNNASWHKAVSPGVVGYSGVKSRFDTYGTQPWNFINKITYLGSPIIGNSCTEKIEYIVIALDLSTSANWTNLYPYRDKYTNEIVFMSDGERYKYPVIKSTLTEWPLL